MSSLVLARRALERVLASEDDAEARIYIAGIPEVSFARVSGSFVLEMGELVDVLDYAVAAERIQHWLMKEVLQKRSVLRVEFSSITGGWADGEQMNPGPDGN